MGNIASVTNIDTTKKTTLVRVDFNVPFRPGTTDISDDSRIQLSIDTLSYLISHQAKIVLFSHLGRPYGKVDRNLRMKPIADRLSILLNKSVLQASDCIGPHVASMVNNLSPGNVLLLENLRFHPGEEENDPKFAKALASLGDIFVNDAFGVAHRTHASTVGITKFLPSVSGLLMTREVEMLDTVLNSKNRPFVAIIGGAKISDKIAIIRNLVQKVDTLIIGGGMAATFLNACGLNTGKSLVEPDRVAVAKEIIEKARNHRVNLLLPSDVVIANKFSDNSLIHKVKVSEIPPKSFIMDIGPQTTDIYVEAISKAKKILWNGTMGVSEWEPFAKGTTRIAHKLAEMSDANTIIGGGSTAEMVNNLGISKYMTHVSTGGGASLGFLEGNTLPGVQALMEPN